MRETGLHRPVWAIQMAGQIVLSFDVGIRNLAYCLARFGADGRLEKLLSWDVVDVVAMAGSKAKTKGLGMQKTVDFMIAALKQIEEQQWRPHKVDSVVIEQQLSKATLLKVLQFTIYTFAKVVFPEAKVSLCHAKHKLQADMKPYGCTSTWRPKERTTRSRILKPTKKQLKSRETQKRYRENKERCTWMASQVLEFLKQKPLQVEDKDVEGDQEVDCGVGDGKENVLDNFDVSKKKDDLADCLIQAIVAVSHKDCPKNRP